MNNNKVKIRTRKEYAQYSIRTREQWIYFQNKHNGIAYIQFENLATGQSYEIHEIISWCYFDPHANTTRMNNYQPQNIGEFKRKKAQHTRNNSTEAQLESNKQKEKNKIQKLVYYAKKLETFHEATRNYF